MILAHHWTSTQETSQQSSWSCTGGNVGPFNLAARVRFGQKINANKLGNVTDLGTFRFGQERASLDAYRSILMDVQRGICLYCQKPLSKQTQVDHFIPWSRYPDDLGHNFVLAHNQ